VSLLEGPLLAERVEKLCAARISQEVESGVLPRSLYPRIWQAWLGRLIRRV